MLASSQGAWVDFLIRDPYVLDLRDLPTRNATAETMTPAMVGVIAP